MSKPTRNPSSYSIESIDLKRMSDNSSLLAEIKIDNQDVKSPMYLEKASTRTNIIQWGEDNMFPQDLINIMQNCVEHNSIAKRVVDMTVGDGINLQPSDSPEYRKFLKNFPSKDAIIDVLEKVCWDLITFGCYSLEVIWAKDGKSISYIKHVPMQNIRKAINEEYDGFKYSDNWAYTGKFKPRFIASFDPSLAVSHPSQIYFSKMYVPGTETYSLPTYFGGLNWILLSHNISTFHLNNAENGYNPSLIFLFKAEASPDVKKALKQKMDDNLKGPKNTGNSILLFSANPDETPEVITISPNQNDKQFQELIEICTQKILNAWRVTDPSIMGIPTAQGLNQSADRMLMAEYRFQKLVIDNIQMFLQRDMNYLMSINGISDTLTLNKAIDEEKYNMLKGLYSPQQTTEIQEEDEKQEDSNSNS